MQIQMDNLSIKFSYNDALPFLAESEIDAHCEIVSEVYQKALCKTGKGNDFLGWMELPTSTSPEVIRTIQERAKALASIAEVVVVIGIGGSYLGTRAVIDMLSPYFASPNANETPTTILYAGNHLSEDYLHDLLTLLDQKEYALIVISKSGTTTEPAIAFRILKEHCEKKYGHTANQRIVAITDKERGALKKMAAEKGYDTFVIPDDVGGRYSVLSPVGLLPIAVAGFNIEALLKGAQTMQEHLLNHHTFANNIALQYALLRFLLYQKEKKMELLVGYEPKLFYFIEWIKQLFGESEGKEGKGIFPAGAIFSTDLHSLGQYIQEGERMLFETVLSIEKNRHHVTIPVDEQNIDQLNYLAHRTIQNINHIAEAGTREAHLEGGVPNLRISIKDINEETIGQLIYFFEFTCMIHGYLLDVNPFDQPGVEAYKRNMFRLLGKE